MRRLDLTGRSPRLRLAVYAPPAGRSTGMLGDVGATFQVDAAELIDFLSELGRGASEGPATAPAPVASGEQASAMTAMGDESPSPEASRRLRGLMLQAAGKMGAGSPFSRRSSSSRRGRSARVSGCGWKRRWR